MRVLPNGPDSSGQLPTHKTLLSYYFQKKGWGGRRRPAAFTLTVDQFVFYSFFFGRNDVAILGSRWHPNPVNEFALVYHLRQSFPLHFIVFKQTASHLPHEANSEQLFSRSGSLSDDNDKMDPAQLAVWTSIGVNYSIYKPTDKQILERYMLKFSKGGKATVAEMHIDDLGLLDPEAEGEAEGGEA